MRFTLLCAPSLAPWQAAAVDHVLAGPHEAVAAVVDQRPPTPLTRKLKNHLRRGRGGYVAVMALRSLVGRRTPRIDAHDFLRRRGVPTLDTDDPYSDRTIGRIAEGAPDVLLLINGFGIVKEPLLGLAPHGVLSYHHGDMRAYRGQPPAFWELYNGESEVGVTVQRLSSGLDCGDPIVERSLAIRPAETLRSLRTRHFGGSVDMLAEAVALVAEEDFRSATIDHYGSVYTIPNLREWVIFNLKVAYRTVAGR